MNEEEFVAKVNELMKKAQDPRNSPDEDIATTLTNDVKGKSKSRKNVEWDNDVADEVMTQFKWFIEQVVVPDIKQS